VKIRRILHLILAHYKGMHGSQERRALHLFHAVINFSNNVHITHRVLDGALGLLHGVFNDAEHWLRCERRPSRPRSTRTTPPMSDLPRESKRPKSEAPKFFVMVNGDTPLPAFEEFIACSRACPNAFVVDWGCDESRAQDDLLKGCEGRAAVVDAADSNWEGLPDPFEGSYVMVYPFEFDVLKYVADHAQLEALLYERESRVFGNQGVFAMRRGESMREFVERVCGSKALFSD